MLEWHRISKLGMGIVSVYSLALDLFAVYVYYPILDLKAAYTYLLSDVLLSHAYIKLV